jgi:N-acyl-D-aspartate/D-glutamate deacylase
MAVDILIRGARVIDGTGGPSIRGDVAVKDGRIAGVGKLEEAAARVIDADGLAVAPGFWDIHTHYDAQLLWDPLATSSSWHGVTTVVTGNCGFTVAPCRPEDQEWMARMLARVEGMNYDVLSRTLPWSWGSFGQYLDRLDQALGVNVLPLVGHSAVRRYAMGSAASEREATDAEIAGMKAVLADCYRAGGVGWTTSRGFSHWDADGKPVPSRVAGREEFPALAEVLRGTGSAGFVEFSPGTDYARWTPEGQAGIRRLARAGGHPVCVLVISQGANDPEGWKDGVRELADLRAEGLPVFALGYVDRDDNEFNLLSTNVFDRWPAWQKVLAAPHSEKLSRLRDPATRAQLREAMKVDPIPQVAIRWQNVFLIRAATDAYARFNAMPLDQVAAALDKDPLDALLDIAVEEDLRTQFRLRDVRFPDENVLIEILKQPHVVAGFTDAGAHLLTEVSTGFCTRLLGYWARDKHAISLERAVHLLTGVPAAEAGVTDRGLLKDGLAADLVLFDPATVGSSGREFVNDFPGGATRLVQYARGIEYTFVNGRLLYANGRPTGDLPGRTLRGTYNPRYLRE